MMNLNYWLMKSEPDVYSIGDLKKDGQTIWEGVRNYQARNFLRQMKRGDLSFFYHSNITPPGIVGLMRVVETDTIDPTQFDRDSPYYDSKSSPDSPRWWTVKVEFDRLFPQLLPLGILKQNFTADELLLVRTGNRLSVMPVNQAITTKILALVARQGV
ncbi:MAG: EVE domain-containing protein [Microcystis aeruginosa W13-11]|nr:EVE domain-containing protein [Microcystis aeruginosa W13-11]